MGSGQSAVGPEAERLARFLRAAAGRPPGPAPCLLVADWIAEVTGADPAAHLRGRLATARGVARVLKRKGGLAPLMGGLLAGLTEIGEPAAARPGDVAAIALPTGDDAGLVVAAIRTAHGWALATEGGVSVVRDATVLRAWRVD